VGSRPLSDEDLVERAREGDVGAYTELVRRHRTIAVRTAYVIAGPSEAEDAAQEGFVKAYRALATFRRDAAFRPWLLRIVANEARNRRRSATRWERLALRDAARRPSGDAAPSPEAAVLGADDRRALLAAVNGLREEDREVVALRYLLDLSEAETAEALGIPRGTVKSRLSRALARLRERLATEEEA
jgi:RNA polymerase sigma factor (sigma-70 family)